LDTKILERFEELLVAATSNPIGNGRSCAHLQIPKHGLQIVEATEFGWSQRAPELSKGEIDQLFGITTRGLESAAAPDPATDKVAVLLVDGIPGVTVPFDNGAAKELVAI